MQELLLTVARGLVEDKDAVTVTVDPPREDGTIVYHLSVAEGDMGRVIGNRDRLNRFLGRPPFGRMAFFIVIKEKLCSSIWKQAGW